MAKYKDFIKGARSVLFHPLSRLGASWHEAWLRSAYKGFYWRLRCRGQKGDEAVPCTRAAVITPVHSERFVTFVLTALECAYERQLPQLCPQILLTHDGSLWILLFIHCSILINNHKYQSKTVFVMIIMYIFIRFYIHAERKFSIWYRLQMLGRLLWIFLPLIG